MILLKPWKGAAKTRGSWDIQFATSSPESRVVRKYSNKVPRLNLKRNIECGEISVEEISFRIRVFFPNIYVIYYYSDALGLSGNERVYFKAVGNTNNRDTYRKSTWEKRIYFETFENWSSMSECCVWISLV